MNGTLPQNSQNKNDSILKLPLKEPISPRYIYINPTNNQVHLLMPILAGECISTDNTCKSMTVFKQFAGKYSDKKNALDELNQYKSALEFDLLILTEIDMYSELKSQKQQRLEQIDKYISAIKNLENVWKNFYNTYPQPIIEILKSKSNFYSIVLRPSEIDTSLYTENPIFSVNRNKNQTFHTALITIFKEINTWMPLTKTIEDTFKASLIKELDEKPCASEEDFKKIQNALQTKTKEISNQTVDFNQTTTSSGSGTYATKTITKAFCDEYVDQPLTSKYIDALLMLCAPYLFDYLPNANSPFNMISNNDNNKLGTLSILTQFFLAHVNLYCYLNQFSNQNFGEVLDKNKSLAEKVALTVKTALIKDTNVEKELLAFIEENRTYFKISQPLSEEDKKNIQQKFSTHWEIIKQSPHLDEFTIFDEKSPTENSGKGFIHQGSFCIDFSEFLIANAPHENISEYFLKTNELSKKNLKRLPPNNHQTVKTTYLNIDQETYLSIIKKSKLIATQIELITIACKENLTNYLSLLISTTKNIHSIMFGKNTLLTWATENNHIEAIKVILNQKNIRINQVDNYGKTPLYWACAKGHTDIIKLLLKHPKIKINKTNENKKTPLHAACINGHSEVVDILLAQKGIKYNCTNIEKRTPLLFAAMHGNINIVKSLLAKGANINTADHNNNSPLDWAFESGHTDMVQTLLSQENINFDIEKLLISSCLLGYTSIIKSLLKLEISDIILINALELAINHHHWDIVEILLIKNDEIPLIWGIEKNHVDFVHALLKKDNPRINQTDENGKSPLHWAIKQGKKDFVTMLLRTPNININQADIYGITPLYLALIKGEKDIIELLLAQENIEISRADRDGQTALDWANKKGFKDIAQKIETMIINEISDDFIAIEISISNHSQSRSSLTQYNIFRQKAITDESMRELGYSDSENLDMDAHHYPVLYEL